MASTRSPVSRPSAVQLLADAKSLMSSRRSSTRRRPGSTPACSKCPCSGLLRVGRVEAPGDLEGGVAVAVGGLHLDHPDGRDPEHGHRDGAVLVVPDLGHADLLADDRLGRHCLVLPVVRGGPRMPTLRPDARAERSTGWPEVPGDRALARLCRFGRKTLAGFCPVASGCGGSRSRPGPSRSRSAGLREAPGRPLRPAAAVQLARSGPAPGHRADTVAGPARGPARAPTGRPG